MLVGVGLFGLHEGPWRELLLGAAAALTVHLADRISLYSDLGEWSHLIQRAHASGVQDIWQSRGEARDEILEAIAERATRRVLVLAVTLSKHITLDELFDALRRNRNNLDPVFDQRVLLMDALRSPALFRTILESDIATGERIIAGRGAAREILGAQPYFEHRLYKKFNEAVGMCWSRTHPERESTVRFYAHDASFWMVIVDDLAYVQPYSFGAVEAGDPDHCLGDLLPLLKITRTRGSYTWEVLLDHFNKLWNTSTFDPWFVAVRNHARGAALLRVLEDRSSWLRPVVETLKRDASGGENRRFPRHPCSYTGPLSCKWQSTRGRASGSLNDVRVIDHGIGGLSLRIDHGSRNVPRVDDEIQLQLEAPEEMDDLTRTILNHLRAPTHGLFLVKTRERKVKNGHFLRVGLAAQPEAL